jgi:hypothetical protein
MANSSNFVPHLQMIQGIVDRLARNSFALKSFTVALVSAVFALAANGADYRFFLIGLLPTLAFWLLDGYYLRQERLFRHLFNAVRAGRHVPKGSLIFSMDISPYIPAGQS